MRQLLILAGGKGTRLKSVTGDIPKPLAKIGDIPILEHQVVHAAKYGFTEIIFLTSYRSELIEEHFGDGQSFGVSLKFLVDETPLGTAGAVLAVLDQLDPHFILLYGDAMHDVDLRRLSEFHLARPNSAATLLVHPNDHPQDSDLVEIDGNFLITHLHGYPHPENAFYRNLVNAGLYVLTRQALEAYRQAPTPLDFAKNLFPEMISQGAHLFGYPSREYIKDMGTPERLQKVNRDYRSGRIAAHNLSRPLPAVFLDRDGTLIRHHAFLNHPDQIELLEGAAQAIRAIHEAGYLAILVTNQPVIARGECTRELLDKIHGKMENLLAQEASTYLDAIYYCPHHPDSGFEGEVKEFKIPCECRKPAPGMILRAAEDLNIDLAHSWIIGDSIRDWETAATIPLTPLFVRSGEDNPDDFPKIPKTATFQNILHAVQSIPKWISNPHTAP